MKSASSIDGISDDTCIANKFADVFSANCRSNLLQEEINVNKTTFYEPLVNYQGAALDYTSYCSVESISSSLNNLSNGKAAGYDLLTAEFLKYCHPSVLVCIARLFSLMFKFVHVPDDFGIGITIPLLKADFGGSVTTSESYRGITIMPILSKLFELVLVKILDPYLQSCETQFGFKKGNSCSHAIYSVRKIVDYFTSQNSTVNICALDISKAFDKICHIRLFMKLMDRNVPRNCLLLIICWFAKLSTCVRWSNSFSYSKL